MYTTWWRSRTWPAIRQGRLHVMLRFRTSLIDRIQHTAVSKQTMRCDTTCTAWYEFGHRLRDGPFESSGGRRCYALALQRMLGHRAGNISDYFYLHVRKSRGLAKVRRPVAWGLIWGKGVRYPCKVKASTGDGIPLQPPQFSNGDDLRVAAYVDLPSQVEHPYHSSLRIECRIRGNRAHRSSRMGRLYGA